jgi:hypothetical protein
MRLYFRPSLAYFVVDGCSLAPIGTYDSSPSLSLILSPLCPL